MGQKQSRIDNPNTNLWNEIDINEGTNLQTIEICLIIITTLVGLNFVLTIYKIHTKKLKKKYYSRAHDLDKV